MTDSDVPFSQHHSRINACVVCGRFDPSLVERHAVAGFPLTLCRNCHRKLIERTAPPSDFTWTPPDDLESIARALLAESDLLSLMAQSRWLLAHALIDRVKRDAPADDDPRDPPRTEL